MKIIIKYASFMFVGYLLLFLIMKFLNLYHIIELRALNFVIHAGGIFYAFKEMQKENPSDFGYLSGFLNGMRITLLSAIPFAFFMMFYLTFIEPEFLQYLRETALSGAYITKGKLFIGLCAEALGSGILISYIAMRYTILLASYDLKNNQL
ncbi:DUF4199 family protein [Flammeovirga aprica]|uniref:DUF4199 family protein n=1 Tax=Flammeovirga aprica JL-4 TaxID=694437 RepID=A0A7X9P0W8_9BACT|nr:DUF4199 family protein [Flammeovirga aprica]NME66967.1 DUF4199 family protein [Flammeovirga aprica JL-4]